MKEHHRFRRVLANLWDVQLLVDEDGHLNICLLNKKSKTITEIETGQGDGEDEQLALRFTTPDIEAAYQEELKNTL